MKVFLLDNGHGKETPGKRSPVWPDGSQLFEWSFNRDMVSRIKEKAIRSGLLVVELVPETEDVSLEERVGRANKWHDVTNGRSVLISIHVNAGGGTGFEVYTSPGTTKADRIATVIFNGIKAAFPGMKMRADESDGDPDKEAGFYILKNTRCPAVLVENLFMDNYADCRFLFQEDFKNRLADAYVEAMQKINEL